MDSIDRVDVFYEPDERPVVCKCGTDIQIGVFAGQWFLDYTSPGWKEETRVALDSMSIIPEMYRNLFENTFDWLAQRPCARRRGVGTRLPFDTDWIIESLSDSTIYMAFYTIAHHIYDNKIKPEQLVPEFFDFIFLGKSTATSIAKVTGIDVALLKQMQSEFRYWYPNDQRHTNPAHIPNHLSFALFHHVAIFPEKYWIQKISISAYLTLEGKKISKSKGNVIPLVEIPEKYGADVFRTYLTSGAEPGSLMDWRERDVPAYISRIRQFKDIASKYAKATPKVFKKKDNPNIATSWLLSRINSVVVDCTEMFENLRLRDYAIQITSELIRTVNHYLNRPGIPKVEREGTMAYVLDIWIRLATPLMPHICEEMWSKMGHDDYVSLAEWPKPDKKLMKPEVEMAHQVVESTIRDVREIVKLMKGKKPKKAHIYVAPEWMFKAMNSIRKANLPIIVGDIMKHLMANEDFRKHGKQVKGIVDRIAKENGLWDHAPSSKTEIAALRESATYMGSELGLEIVIHASEKPEYDPQNKARFALPGRVSLFLE
jgi:leucyl-tRNA synthetase